MSSEIIRADRLTESLVSRLRGVLPDSWRIADLEAGAVQALGIVLYFEQLDFVNEPGGVRLSPGYIGVEYKLTLTAAPSEPVKGTAAVTGALLVLLPALDDSADLFWGPTAEKVRFDTGETGYTIPITFLSTYSDLTPEEA